MLYLSYNRNPWSSNLILLPKYLYQVSILDSFNIYPLTSIHCSLPMSSTSNVFYSITTLLYSLTPIFYYPSSIFHPYSISLLFSPNYIKLLIYLILITTVLHCIQNTISTMPLYDYPYLPIYPSYFPLSILLSLSLSRDELDVLPGALSKSIGFAGVGCPIESEGATIIAVGQRRWPRYQRFCAVKKGGICTISTSSWGESG